MFRSTILSMIVVVFIATLLGCSSGRMNPTMPGQIDNDLSIPVLDSNNSNRSLLGVWNVEFDVDNLSASIELDRISAMHYNITTLMPAPGIVVNSYNTTTGVADVDVTINNPFTFGAYDIRLIIYSDTVGHVLENRDNWTSLWDIPEGYPINGFKAYAKTQPNRLFTGQTQHTENLRIYMPGGNFSVQFAIDASFPSNCEEPYLIENFNQTILFDIPAAEADLEVDVLDWQDDVDSVWLHCPVITGNTIDVFTDEGSNKWSVTIANNNAVAAGQYTGYIIANSGGLALYDEVVVTVSPEGVEGWALTWGAGNGDMAHKVALDSSRNVYVIGEFKDTVDFDPGDGILEVMAIGSNDNFLSKFNEDGELQWVRTWGNANMDYIRNLAVDDTGCIYTLGMFNETVDFDPGPGTCNLTSSGYYDAYISKFNPSGDFQWAVTWGSPNYDSVYGICLSDYGDIYVTGEFNGTIDFDPGPGFCKYTDKGMQDCYVTKFSTTGYWFWARAWGDEGWDNCLDAAVAQDDSVYIVGPYSKTVDFDPGAGETKHTAVGLQDAFISNYRSNGTFQWVAVFGGIKDDEAKSICIDGDDNFYVSGTFNETVDFDPGVDVDEHVSNGWTDSFLCKYDASRNYQWTIILGGSGQDVAYSLHKDDEGNMLIGGGFDLTVDFDPGPGEQFVTSEGSRDAYLVKLNENGQFNWVCTWGSVDHDCLYGIYTDTDNSIYTCGFFQNMIDFDPGSGVKERTSNGNFDAFFLKLNTYGGM